MRYSYGLVSLAILIGSHLVAGAPAPAATPTNQEAELSSRQLSHNVLQARATLTPIPGSNPYPPNAVKGDKIYLNGKAHTHNGVGWRSRGERGAAKKGAQNLAQSVANAGMDDGDGEPSSSQPPPAPAPPKLASPLPVPPAPPAPREDLEQTQPALQPNPEQTQ